MDTTNEKSHHDHRLKVAVYAIAKNEKQFVKAFMDSVQEADHVIVLDTGSTDGTTLALIQEGATVLEGHFSRWRFDDARNASLAFVPQDVDVCICLDLDEVLMPGWRDALEHAWQPETTRLRYPYTWSWQADGSPGVVYYADKIHKRRGYRWRMPCHEVLQYDGHEVQTWTQDLKIEHHADNSKPRSNYLPLLAIAHQENPDDDRTTHYYARELYFYGHHKEAAELFRRHITMPSAKWDAERAQSMIYLSHCEPQHAVYWARRAMAESPNQRETWYHLAKTLWQVEQDAAGAIEAARRAEAIPSGNGVYLMDPEAQGYGPKRLISTILSALHTSAHKDAGD